MLIIARHRVSCNCIIKIVFYFSELKDKKVITNTGTVIGKLSDLIFSADSKAIVTKLVIQKYHSKNILVIPTTDLIKINRYLVIKSNFLSTNLAENELYIDKNLLNKQIIDLRGDKIVRVNDVVIRDKPFLCLLGIDYGWLGMVRWLKVEALVVWLAKAFGLSGHSRFLGWTDIQPLELARGHIKLKKEEKRLTRMNPEDLADYLEKTNIKSIIKILGTMETELVAQVVASLNLNYQSALFHHIPEYKAGKIIELMDPDEAVDVLSTLSIRRREKIIKFLDLEKQRELEKLFSLAYTEVGRLITSEFMTVRSEEKAGKIIEKIHKGTTDFSYLSTLYVVNEKNQLIGVFNLHELILQDFRKAAYKFMIQNVVVAHLTTPAKTALKIMLKYTLSCLPVIDANKHILGIITIDDVAETIIKKYR